MRRVTIVAMILAAITLFAGCTEQQLNQADKVINDVNNIANTGAGLSNTPVGAMIPDNIKALLAALGLVTSAGVNVWQQIRGSLMKKTLKAIISGVEASEAAVKTNPSNPVKTAIEAQMVDAKIYDKANKLVDQIKVGLI